MKIGVMFIRGDGVFFSKAIRLFTRGEWSHVAIEITEDHILESEIFQRCQILQKNQVDYYNLKHEVIEIELTDEQHRKMVNAIGKAIGKKYDYKLIIKILLKCIFKKRINFTNDEEFICSELASWLLYNIGVINNKKVMSYSPNGLYRYLKKLGV